MCAAITQVSRIPGHQIDTLVIGGGMSAARLVSRLNEGGFRGAIGWVSAERNVGYNRVLLPDFLSAECTQADLEVPQQAGPAVEVYCGVQASSLDVVSRTVALDDGAQLTFRRLVLATGGVVPRPPVPGLELPGVLELRSLADAQALRTLARTGKHAVVIGGGLLGLEAGKALLALGLQVRVVHRQPLLLNRQLDEPASTLLRSALERQGFAFSCGAELAGVTGVERCESVTLTNDECWDADIVVLATGVQPNDELARTAGLTCQQGIATNPLLETSAREIYALGECASVLGRSYSLVEPVFAQADALAQTLMGTPTNFVAPRVSTRLKVSGVQLFSAGEVHGSTTSATSDIVISDAHAGLYRRLLFVGQELIGAVLLGNVSGARAIQAAVNSSIENPTERERLAFGY